MRRKKEKIRRMKNKKRKEKKENREGHYGHSTLLSTLHSQEKLFCQTFFKMVSALL
jgi:hypothetical protein